MWTLVIHHESDECGEYSHYDSCQSDVNLYECETAEEVQKYLTDLMYDDKYGDNGEYYWSLFKGRDLNANSDWSPETTGGLDLHEIVDKATVAAEARKQEVQRRLKEQEEKKKAREEEMKRLTEKRKAQLLENNEKAQLDSLLRKHGLPDWMKEVSRD